MSTTHPIAMLLGSLRRDSFSRKMAHAVSTLAPASLDLEIVEIGAMPHYNADLDEGAPPVEWRTFRERLQAKQGVLFITPEFNRSIPGALKNAIDVGSRPYGQGVLIGKPCAVISLSPGALGGFGANHHLRQPLVCLNMPAMQQPEAYIGNVDKLFDQQGALSNEAVREFLTQFMRSFAQWVERHV